MPVQALCEVVFFPTQSYDLRMKRVLILLASLLVVGCATGKYVGGYKDGKFHGQGTVTFADGRKYVGEFKGGHFNGQGTYTFPDGGQYVGEFKDDKFHGQGTSTHPDGRKYVGEFKGNRFWTGIFYDSDGNVLSEYQDGVEIKQQ